MTLRQPSQAPIVADSPMRRGARSTRCRAPRRRDPKAAVREAAKQFEALFMQELMKSMRQATMHSGMLDNEGTQARHRDARHPVRHAR